MKKQTKNQTTKERVLRSHLTNALVQLDHVLEECFLGPGVSSRLEDVYIELLAVRSFLEDK